jgi:hydrogenase maturation protease
MKTVIGGVGYRMLRDYSAGVVISDELAPYSEPPQLHVEDLSYNPVAMAQWFADEARSEPFTRAVFVSAVVRGNGAPAGTIRAYRWNHELPDADEIQRAVTDAVTGVISVDNTLVVAEWMKALPPETIVVELEPQEHEFGTELSEAVSFALSEAREIIMKLATDEEAVRSLPCTSLGGVP